MAKKDYGCDGTPEKPTNDLGGFATDKFESTNNRGTAVFESEGNADEAIAKFGPVKRAGVSSSILSSGPVTIPKAGSKDADY